MSDQALKAARVYFRMLIILLFATLLIYLFFAGRINETDMLRAVLGAILAYLTGDTALMKASQNAAKHNSGD